MALLPPCLIIELPTDMIIVTVFKYIQTDILLGIHKEHVQFHSGLRTRYRFQAIAVAAGEKQQSGSWSSDDSQS